MSKIYCNPYKITTITCSYNFNTPIDFSILSENIKDDNLLTIDHRNKFINSIKLIYKSDSLKSSIKIFNNGNMQLLGIKDIEDTKTIINYIKNKINPNEDILIDIKDIKILLINASFQLFKDNEFISHHDINLNQLCDTLNKIYKIKCYRQTITDDRDRIVYFPYIILDFYLCDNHKIKNGACYCNKKCKKNKIFIYDKGHTIITGAISFDQILEIHDFFNNFKLS